MSVSSICQLRLCVTVQQTQFRKFKQVLCHDLKDFTTFVVLLLIDFFLLAGFFKFVVAPLFEEWHRFLDTPLSRNMINHLRNNQARWDILCQQEADQEIRTEISDAEVRYNFQADHQLPLLSLNIFHA